MWFELLISFVILAWILHYQKIKRLPPGPFSLPILGTLDFIIPSNKSFVERFFSAKFMNYKDFCPIYLGNYVIVLINDFKLAKELFSKDEFSGREQWWWNENVRGINGRTLGIIDTEGSTWVEQRRFALKHLRDLGFGRKALDSVMNEEADQVIDRLILQSKSGFDPDHPETKQMIEMLEAQLKSMTHRKMLGNLLQYLPLKKSDKSVIEHKSMMKKFISEHLEDIDYDHPRDFIDVYLTEMRNNSNFDEDHLIVMCLDFFQAGAETTSTSLLWAVLFMTLHQKVQKNCQMEIFEQIGTRSPTSDDIKKVPYVMATLMEIQRVSVVAPASLPHTLMSDTVVNGYMFKKNTQFLANLTKFLKDPQVFHNPESFDPERFRDVDGKIRKIDQFTPFGIGKRICMGESLSKNELFIFFVRMMQRVTFQESAKKPNINDVDHGITRVPKPFEVKVILN